jgi:hypothetical protein
MTILIGVILLAVFLCFAVLMFLERISALLALPLMAITFLLVASGADLIQPSKVIELTPHETVDQFGRRKTTVQERPSASRFELWKQVRLCQARILRDKAALLAESVDALEAELTRVDETLANRLTETLARIRIAELEFTQRADDTLDALPDFFARPPHYAGQRARFDEAFDAIAISESLKPIATLLDRHSAGAAVPKIREVLAGVNAESRRFTERYAAVPDPRSARFRFVSAAAYLLEYLMFVVRAGSLHLYAAIIATVFGGMFAMYVKNLRVAERLVYWTAEFAGERPFIIALAVFLVTAGIFTSVGGLGTVIMLGTIILPILRSVGLSPIVAAGTFLIAIAMGGTLQPVARRLWLEFYGIPAARLDSILWTMVGLYAACGLAWIWWGTRRRLLSSFHAVVTGEQRAPESDVPARLMIAPLIPVALVYFAGVEEITAFTVSIVYMYLCICRRRGAVRLLARSLIEGAQTVMPPVLLMVGIGLLITALTTPPVQSYLRPLLSAAVPESRWGYIALFSIAAPLALYRGPLNVWGMGLAVSATLLATSGLPPAAILCAILAAGMLQGVCDPTNTANVWIAGFQGVTVNQILRYTVLPVWTAAIIAVVIFGLRFVEGS